MKVQPAKQNESKIRRIFLLPLLILTLLANSSCAAQQQQPKTTAEAPKISESWEVTFGHSYGRYHENTLLYKIGSDGQTFFQENRKAPVAKEIAAESVAELNELVKRLDLTEAEEIPTEKYNACIQSLHSPETYFTLKIAEQKYALRHCNDKEDYEYTLILSREQKEIYRRLREKALAHFDQIK